ncbi:fungal-specific transcription factor domain-containing protein [Fusarium oxysporum II5]|nr:fungal-specific transcription factor domain-containing protein [Fusarium oxysporum II5]
MSQQNEPAKLSKACSYCRTKKVKCDSSVPCGNCRDRDKHCVYLPKSRRRRKRNEKRMLSPESRPNSATFTCHLQIDDDQGDVGSEVDGGNIVVDRAAMTPHGCFPRPDTQGPDGLHSGSDCASAAEPIQLGTSQLPDMPLTRHQVAQGYNSETHTQMSLAPGDSEADCEEATIDLKDINWEHHGPGSWLSICSEPGVRWVSVRARASGFNQVAQDLIADWTKHLTLSQSSIREKGPEPDFDTAWHYATSYFEYSHDSIFGVVYRPEFEDHLRRHFHCSSSPEKDTASYAMRNAVYAAGCRAAAAMDGVKDFKAVQERSLQFFFNAISVYAQLVYMPTGLRAVQALIVMTSFAELLGSPSVEYMLCSTAVRLAQSKGLHRQPAKAWGLSELDVLNRSWMFWALYCHDKYIALRSGRPSIIDDDDVSCEIPTTIPAGSAMDVTLCTAFVKHAQICSETLKRFYSAQGHDKSPETRFREVEYVESKLSEWRDHLPDHVPVDSAALVRLQGSYKVRANIIRLHRAYWGSIIELHASFHYPWICSRIIIANKNNNYFRDAVARSSTHTADAARQIIASLRHWVPDLNSSSTAAFYYPMLAIINVLVYILKYPSLTTTLSDIAFLDMGSGHFGYIHHLTCSHVSFRFPREAVTLANKAPKKSASETPGPATEMTDVDTPGETSNSVDRFLDMDITPDQLDALSLELFDNFLASGDMVML